MCGCLRLTVMDYLDMANLLDEHEVEAATASDPDKLL